MLQWAALTGLLALFAAIPGHTATGWHFFVVGAQLMFGGGPRGGPGGGIHTYAGTPELQSGPLSYLLAWPAVAAPGRTGRLPVMVLTLAAGLLVIGLVTAMAGTRSPRRTRFVAAACLAPAWVDLAWRSAHLDDVLAMTLTVAAVATRLRGRFVATSVLLALAVDAKPWAVVFLVLLLPAGRGQEPAARGGETGRRELWRRSASAFAIAGALLAVAWLPFVLGDTHTVAALRAFTIPNDFDSGLRALGITDPRTPGWVRPVQGALGIGLGAVAMLRGRVWAVPLIGIATRLAIDPGAHDYYTAGVLVSALLADAVGGLWRGPWASLTALVLIWAPTHVLPLVPTTLLPAAGVTYGAVKLLVLAVLTALVLLRGRPGPRLVRGAPATRPGDAPLSS